MPNLITVTSAADSGAGSLRAAIAAAQDGDTIQFAGNLANQTITLTSGDISISKNIEIDGSGAANLALSGNHASRIFSAGGGVNFAVKNLAIVDGKTDGKGGGIWLRDSGTAITVMNCRFENNEAGIGGAIQIGYGGKATVLSSQFNGNKGISANNGFSAGAIANDGSGELVIKDSQFTNNQGFNGGAIYSLLSPLTVENCKFLNNEAIGEGGGAIFTDGGNPVGPGGTVAGTIAVKGSWFEGNKAKGEGGALFLYGYQSDKILLEDSTVINNSVAIGTQGFGNGIARGGGLRSNSDLTLRNVTFANNTAAGQGGGIWIDGDSPTNIFNSTFSGNRVTGDVGGAMVFNTGINAPVNIVNSTIVNNWANRANGAIWMNNENQPVTLTNSIVAFNTASGVYYEQQVGYQPRDGGGNIEYPAPIYPGRRVAANSQIVDPQIDTLQNVGGMLVHPLLAGSPAVNAGVVYPKTLGVTNTDIIGGTDNAAVVYTQPIGVTDPQTIGVKTVEQPNVQPDATPEIRSSDVPLNPSDNGKVTPSKYVKVNGSAANDVLVGSAEYNYLVGVAGDDWVVGNSKQDILMGGLGDDTLIGNRGSDRQTGGAGADRFVYSGASRLSAFRDSTLNRFDQITDFDAAEGDRIQLDFDSKFPTADLPKGLFVAINLSGRSLLDAVNAAYADKNSAVQGAQALSTEESVLLKWNNRTFLILNDKNLGFSRSDDLVVELMGVNLTTLPTNAGTLAVDSYFA
jgi:Right handed beta helix region/RTX calcium-binding nonapeptide repeat (4 copies)